jgi:hypothetical protein
MVVPITHAIHIFHNYVYHIYLQVHQIKNHQRKTSSQYMLCLRFRFLRVLRVLDEVSYYTCASFVVSYTLSRGTLHIITLIFLSIFFQPNSQKIFIGTQAGEMHVFDSNTAEVATYTNYCHYVRPRSINSF